MKLKRRKNQSSEEKSKKQQTKSSKNFQIEKEIREEALNFLRTNKGTVLDKENPQALKYISPRISSEFMDCSMPLTFDHYSHCSLGCQYCFAYMFKSNNLSFANKLHGVDPKVFINAIEGKKTGVRHRSLQKHFFNKRFLLHWGGLADPFCNFEKTNYIGYEIIKGLAENAYPTLFSFKGSAMWRPKFQKLFEKYSHQKNFAFQISIIAPSDEMSRKIEIGVPVTSRRIDAIKNLSDMGYYTILRLRPFIIGITDDGLDELLHRCLEAGIKAISTEFVALDIRMNEGLIKRYKWLGDIIGTTDIVKYFKKLSPSERGGYMRLNRMIKEPYVKQIYKFCLDNDILFACSDPDFKELNMSGSCCGMPDNYEENKELCNWTKNQLTWHIKEARKQYHTIGRYKKLHFNKVFRPKVDTYLESLQLGQDHPSVADKTSAERRLNNYLSMAKLIWNNLRSPANPRNYFHGKILPFTKDGDGNLVFRYNPSEYEERWLKEGINLKK